MYKKDQSRKILIFSIVTYVLGVFTCHTALKPFSKIVDEVETLEEAVVSEKWKEAIKSLDNIESEWEKYEILIRIMNHQEVSDEFELRLDECRLLLEHENPLAIRHVAVLRDDLTDMTSALPTP